MDNSIRLFTIALLSVSTLSLLAIFPVYASGAWYGNDDGEFDRYNNYPFPDHVGLSETFDQPMRWNPAGSYMSMQYNPDQAASICCDHDQWFQTGIIAQSTGCGFFTIQVYNIAPGGAQVFRADQNINQCSTGYFDIGAKWSIQEDILNPAANQIFDVAFLISSGTTSFSYTIYPPTNWNWIKSNLCWCGTSDFPNISFTSAHGTSTAYSDLQLAAVDPPIAISTGEDSNIRYSTWSNSGNTYMYQSYFWPFDTTASPSVTNRFFCTPTHTCPASQSGTVTVTAAHGFSGTVSLSYTPPNPSGLTQITGPSSIQVSDGGSTTITVTIYHGAVSGLFTWTITGTSGSFLSSGTITINEYVCSGTSCPTAPSG